MVTNKSECRITASGCDAGTALRRAEETFDPPPFVVYTMRMARINVYVPDDLAEEARRAGLNVSSLTQAAISATLLGQSTDAWLLTLRPAPRHTATHESAISALDAVRDAAPTRHG